MFDCSQWTVMNITTFHWLGLGLVGPMTDHSNTSAQQILCVIMTLITVRGKLATGRWKEKERKLLG